MAKVKIHTDINADGVTYEIRSKSLSQALQRALIAVEALGDDRVDFDYYVSQAKKTRKHVFVIDVGWLTTGT